MIQSLVHRQRGDCDMFGQGLRDMFAGRETPDSEAAAFNLASAIIISANANTENKWSKGGG